MALDKRSDSDHRPRRLVRVGWLLVRCTQALLVVGCVSIALGGLLIAQQSRASSASNAEEFQEGHSPLSEDEQHLLCYQERDQGLIEALRHSAMEFCASSHETTADTKVTLLKARAGVRATVFSNLTLDLFRVNVNRPIQSLAQDGGWHDPRFMFRPNMIHCQCAELEQYARTRRQTIVDQRSPGATTSQVDALLLWSPTLTHMNTKKEHPSTLCSPRFESAKAQKTETLKGKQRRPSGYEKPSRLAQPPDVTIANQALLIARKDDHNPFFQISNALNAWILMKALHWDPAETQVVHLDGGFPSPVDALHERLLSPGRSVIRGRDLRGKVIQFQSQAMLTPFESEGPMMQNLNSRNPCFNSSLIQEFRLASLSAFNFSVDQVNYSARSEMMAAGVVVSAAAKPIVVTIITRRPYNGRKVQRVWRNEDDVVNELRSTYAKQNVEFRSIDFANLDLQEQMELMLQSDVVIGMHGAGMVNVLWTRPETLVLEIFPKKKKRWGYRNLCQNIGCTYRDFRGGRDIPTNRKGKALSNGKEDANANDKVITFDEFFAFFSPLFEQFVQSTRA